MTTRWPWRVGTKVPLHVYEQRGAEPDTRYPQGDAPVAMFRWPADAIEAVRAVNVVRRWQICDQCGTSRDRCRSGRGDCCPDCIHEGTDDG